MARLQKGSCTFFRLSPAERAKAQSFGVKRGEITGRFDVNYWRLGPYVAERLGQSRFPVEALGRAITRAQYGSSRLARPAPPGTPILRMNNLQEDGWALDDLKYVELPEGQIESYRLEQGDILFNRTNSKELVGKCAVFREPGLWVFASYLIRVQTDPDRLDPQFAADFLSAPIGRLQIDRLSRQIIGMTNINAEEIRFLRIPLPPFQHQVRLVTAMDAARAERRAKLAEAEGQNELFTAFLLEKLGLALPKLPEQQIFAIKTSALRGGFRSDPGYHHPKYREIAHAFAACPIPKATLGEISPTVVGGATPSRSDTSLYTDGGVKFLRIMNVRGNQINLKDMKYIQDEVHQRELRRSQLAIGDVLLTITGRVGTAAVVTADLLPANINQHIVRLRISRDDVLPEYLAAYLNSEVGFVLSNRGVTGGTRVALDYGAIRALQIPMPAIGVQQEIIAELERRRNEAQRLRCEAENGWQAARQWFENQLLGEPVA